MIQWSNVNDSNDNNSILHRQGFFKSQRHSQEEILVADMRRHLQSVISTSTTINGPVTFENKSFISTDNTFDTIYMVTVANISTPGMSIIFKNCVIDVRGNFFQSTIPVNLIFDQCTFRVANTNNLLSLDYSGGSLYGCTGISLNDGDIEIRNSLFTDAQSSSTVGFTPADTRYLFYVRSLYDFKLSNVTLNNLQQFHVGYFSDHQCTGSPLKTQKITLEKLTVSNMNTFLRFLLDGYQQSTFPAQSVFNLNQVNFTSISLSQQQFLHLTMRRSKNLATGTAAPIQAISLSGIYAGGIILDSAPLFHIEMTGTPQSQVSVSFITVELSLITDFLRIDGADAITISNTIKFDQIDSSKAGATALDPTKSALLSIGTSTNVSLDQVSVTNSAMTVSPAILLDTISTVLISNNIFTSVKLTTSDLIYAKKVKIFVTTNNAFTNILNFQSDSTRFAFSIVQYILSAGVSALRIDRPVFKNNQIALLSVRGVVLSDPADTSKYLIQIQYCQFQNNALVGYDLLGFSDLPITRLAFESTFCIADTLKPVCPSGQYFETILKQCTPCPAGCATCQSGTLCQSCSVPAMTVNPLTGLCECPLQQYYFDKDGLPRCRQCLSKCKTCQNEYQCLTYASCTNALQTINPTTQQCQFPCQQGLVVSKTTCSSCTLTGCLLCDKQTGQSERCALCSEGYYLDLKTYTCVASCPAASKAVSSKNTQSKGKAMSVNYCRPFVNNVQFNYEYYVDPNSTSHIELGTYEYPFKNMDSPAKEIFNFMYEAATVFTVYHRRGTSMKHYYGIMPIIIVNVQLYNLTTYGDSSLPKPRVFITGHDYLWPDSTIFSLAETYYDFGTRVGRGDMDVSESTKFFLKFNVFRSSMTIYSMDFQSIMFGDAWSNPLIFSFDAPNRTVSAYDCYFDLDGAYYEAYFPISVYVKGSHFNLTNYQYGVWNDFRWDCYANNAQDIGGYLIIEDTLFTDHHKQALYNFFYFSSFDDFILRNCTFDGCTYLDMETRPFVDVHPQSMCDPAFRTQRIFLDQNHFVNLDGSSLMFAINYMQNFNGTKIFSLQNNTFVNSSINTQLISMQIQYPSSVTVANNYYSNVTVLKDKKVFYFFSEKSNITIRNETLVNNVMDDLYTIGAANNVIIEDFSMTGNTNTGAITETSAIIRVSTAANMCLVRRFQVSGSDFKYGKAIEIEQARVLSFSDAAYKNNSLQNQDFFVFNQIVKSTIANLTFDSFSKVSDKSRFALALPTLTLVPGVSQHDISNITFTRSHASFLSVSQVQTQTDGGLADWKGTYQFSIKNCSVQNNSLGSKDSLIEFGEINYQNFSVQMRQVDIINNVLELGTIYQLKMNCREFIIKDSKVLNNQGQFALLEPASSDETNPLNFYLERTTFTGNYARADALVQLTTNAILKSRDSSFTENYSVGRGSVVFADYQAVFASFTNCTFMRNYAYQGGVFYVQYSSQVEVSNCTMTENFGVTGGVAYVNNDGQIRINNGTRVFRNSALNTCFLFLINTQFESVIDNITVTQNDQANSLIPKDQFLQQTQQYKHIKAEFFAKMAIISDKVQRTINEKADSAVYAIKARVNFTSTDISSNDIFLSASTESTVGMRNTTIRDLTATGKVFQAVSSTIELYSVSMLRVKYTRLPMAGTSDGTLQPNFYKVTIVNKSFLRANNCTFDTIDGLLIYVSGSTLQMENSTRLTQTVNDDREAALVSIDTSTVSIVDTDFTGIKSLYFSPIFNLQDTQMSMTSTSFRDFDKTLFNLEGGVYSFDRLKVRDGQMTWHQQDAFMVNSIVFDVSAADLAFLNSDIQGIFSNYSSPIVYIENDPTASEPHTLLFNNSRFIENVANESAGVVHAVNTNVTIERCQFENNSALLGDAGALLLECQDAALAVCHYSIKHCIFRNNSAKVNGGAIKYTYYAPDTLFASVMNNTFINNSAEYGATIASYPVQMRFIGGRLVTPPASLSGTVVVFELDLPLVSGSLMPQNISLELLDESNRTMITDNQSLAVMSTLSPQVTVMKSKSVKAQKGRFTFDDVIVVGPPGTDILLKITTDSISREKIARAYPELDGKLPEIYVKGRLRLCLRGEFQTTDFKCILCSDGFFTLTENQQQCQECPENAVCRDGFNISLDQGYWRANTTSINIFECYNRDACLGGYDSKCAIGYGGNLCHSCVVSDGKFHSRESNNFCVDCLDYTTNSWRLAGVTVLVIAYFIALIWVNLRSQDQQQRLNTAYMRILTNYFQILTLASSYDLSWSDNMKEFLRYISIIAQSSQILFSVDCFIKDNGIDTEPVYFKMILACLFPFLGIVVVSIFWGAIWYFRKNSDAATKLIMTIIILIFMTLPAVTTITFAIYNCIDVFSNGDTYLAVDMSLQCWTGDHRFYSNRFGIPIIVIWILGLPLLALYILFRKRATLQEEKVLLRYGFLHTGLNHNAYYWEILLHFRKVLMICINVFLTTFKPLYRALIGFMLMIVYIEVLQKVQPYLTPEINDLEFKANIAAFATFYGGLFFISSDLPMAVTTILFILIFFFNLIFWYSWAKMMFASKFVWLRNKLVRSFCKGRFAIVQLGENGDIIEANSKLMGEASAFVEDESRLPEMGEDQSRLQGDEEMYLNGSGGQKARLKVQGKQGSETNKKRPSLRSGREGMRTEKVPAQDATQILDESQRHGLMGLDESHQEEEEYCIKAAVKRGQTKQTIESKKTKQEQTLKSGKTKNISHKSKQLDGSFEEDDSSFSNPIDSSISIKQKKANGKQITHKNVSPPPTTQNKHQKHQQHNDKKRKSSSHHHNNKKEEIEVSDSFYEESISLASSISIGDDSSDQTETNNQEDSHDIYRAKERGRKSQSKEPARKSKSKEPPTKGGKRKPKEVSSSEMENSKVTPNTSNEVVQQPQNEAQKRSPSKNRQQQQHQNAGELIDKQFVSQGNNKIKSRSPRESFKSSADSGPPRIPLNFSDRQEQRANGSKSREKRITETRNVLDVPAQTLTGSQVKNGPKEKSATRKQSSEETPEEKPRITTEFRSTARPTTKPSSSTSSNMDPNTLKVLNLRNQQKQKENDLNKSRIDSQEEDDGSQSDFEQARVHTVKYKKQMNKKGRNEPDKKTVHKRQEIDLSQQQQSFNPDDPQGNNKMNNTMKEQEKLFQNSKKPMEMTLQNFARKKQPRMKEEKQGHIEENEDDDDDKLTSRRPPPHQHRSSKDRQRDKSSPSKNRQHNQEGKSKQDRSKSRAVERKKSPSDDEEGNGPQTVHQRREKAQKRKRLESEEEEEEEDEESFQIDKDRRKEKQRSNDKRRSIGKDERTKSREPSKGAAASRKERRRRDADSRSSDRD